MRRLGVAGFKLGELEVTFWQMPIEVEETKQRVEGFEETDDEEETDAEKRLARLRKAQLDADIHGSA